jgi:hypothetical protein
LGHSSRLLSCGIPELVARSLKSAFSRSSVSPKLTQKRKFLSKGVTRFRRLTSAAAILAAWQYSLQSAAVLWDGPSAEQWQSLKNTGQHLGIKLFAAEMRDQPYNYGAAWDRVPAEYRGMLILPTSPIFFLDRQEIADFTVERRIPAMFVFREWVDAGGLVSYGTSITALFERAAGYVDRLAKGATPPDLPIEQPTKFELILNLKTAKPHDS